MLLLLFGYILLHLFRQTGAETLDFLAKQESNKSPTKYSNLFLLKIVWQLFSFAMFWFHVAASRFENRKLKKCKSGRNGSGFRNAVKLRKAWTRDSGRSVKVRQSSSPPGQSIVDVFYACVQKEVVWKSRRLKGAPNGLKGWEGDRQAGCTRFVLQCWTS